MSSLRFGEDRLVYSFWKEDVPGVDREARMPDLTDIVPKAVMATVPDWPEKSRWFFGWSRRSPPGFVPMRRR